MRCRRACHARFRASFAFKEEARFFVLFSLQLALSLPNASSDSTVDDDGPIHVPSLQGIPGLDKLIESRQTDSLTVNAEE